MIIPNINIDNIAHMALLKIPEDEKIRIEKDILELIEYANILICDTNQNTESVKKPRAAAGELAINAAYTLKETDIFELREDDVSQESLSLESEFSENGYLTVPKIL